MANRTRIRQKLHERRTMIKFDDYKEKYSHIQMERQGGFCR